MAFADIIVRGKPFYENLINGSAEKTALITTGGGLQGTGIGVLAADGYGTLNLDTLQDGSARRRLTGDGPETGYDLAAPTAWLFGNEAQGLSEDELALADHRVAVPIYGAAESLNLGTAATVCLYASARSQQ